MKCLASLGSESMRVNGRMALIINWSDGVMEYCGVGVMGCWSGGVAGKVIPPSRPKALRQAGRLQVIKCRDGGCSEKGAAPHG